MPPIHNLRFIRLYFTTLLSRSITIRRAEESTCKTNVSYRYSTSRPYVSLQLLILKIKDNVANTLRMRRYGSPHIKTGSFPLSQVLYTPVSAQIAASTKLYDDENISLGRLNCEGCLYACLQRYSRRGHDCSVGVLFASLFDL